MKESTARDQEGFLAEAWESLAAIEDALGRWRQGSLGRGRDDLEMVCHRLSGTAALYGWTTLAALAHRLERVVHRQPAAPLDPEGPFLALLDGATALLSKLLERISAEGSDALPDAEDCRSRLDRALESPAEPERAAAEERDPAPAVEDDLHRFRREQPLLVEPFTLEAEELWDGLAGALGRLGRSPHDLEALDDLFRRTHTLKGAAFMVDCRPVGELSHLAEELVAGYHRQRQPVPRPALAALGKTSLALRAMLDLLAGSDISPAAIYRDATEALASAPTLAAPEDVVAAPAAAPVAAPAAPRGDGAEATAGRMIRVERGRLDALLDVTGEMLAARDAVDRRLDHLGSIGEQLAESRGRMSDAVSRFGEKYLDALTPPDERTPEASPDPPPAASGEALDELGELELERYDDFNVLARHVVEISDDVTSVERDLEAVLAELRAGSAHLQKLIRQARGEIGRTRLGPLGPLFERLGRLVAEVAEEEGKLVDVELEGRDVQADGALVDRISEPLLHLLQNAVIHGIETPLVRLEACKPPRGRIELRAEAHGSSLKVEIEDDGAGIDLARLREIAVEQRFATREEIEALGEDSSEIIYLPGLSTRAQVSRRAGRGVGMDVVRDAVARLGGDIETSTEPGHGTRFVLTLPATLVLSEVLVVRVGEERYALSLPAVKRVLALAAAEVAESGDALRLDESDYPLRYLSQVLGRPKRSQPSAETPVLLLAAGGRRLALAVDLVEGIVEATVRPFDDLLADVTLFAGGISTPDGALVLVLDSAALIRFEELGEAADVPAATDAPPAEGTGAARILVVDDSISVRKVLRRTLERAGFDVATAADGLEALEALRERPYHAVVTDLEMPRFNGYELIEDLRRRYSPERLPIVVITTRTSHRHAERARARGASAYLYKPIDDGRLVALLRESAGHPAVALGPPGRVPETGTPASEFPS